MTTLINSTLSGNSAPTGGNLYLGAGTIVARNSIVTGAPNGGNCSSAITDGGHNLSNDATCGFGAGDNTNPLLDPAGLANNGGLTQTIALEASSPAISAGDDTLAVDQNSNPLTTDQRGAGYPRIVGSAVDIGAFESSVVAPPLLQVDTVSDTDLEGCTTLPNDCSLRRAINVANAQAGADTITFDPTLFSTPQTILLISALPQITSDMTIHGAGANVLTIDGAHRYQPFYIDSGVSVGINEPTITHGSASSPTAVITVQAAPALDMQPLGGTLTATTVGGLAARNPCQPSPPILLSPLSRKMERATRSTCEPKVRHGKVVY